MDSVPRGPGLTQDSLETDANTSLETRISEGKLGLILRLDLDRDAHPPFGVRALPVAGVDRLMVRPSTVDARGIEPIAIPPFELEASGASLFTDSSDRKLAVAKRLGLGSVAITSIVDSYRWAQGGRADVHRRYWMTLVEAVTPPQREARWLLPPGPILLDEPFTITLAAGTVPEVTIHEPDGSQSRVPMRQHPTQPLRFSATLWPRLPGWHQLTVAGAEAATSFYAAGNGGWVTWRLARRQRATQALASPELLMSDYRARRPWGRVLALAVLITALGVAWIDERRSAPATGP